MVIAGSGWTFFYLKDVHPLGALGSKLGRDHMAGIGIRFNDATLIGRSGGKKVWNIKAKMIDISKDRRIATFQGLTQGSLIRDDKKVASISADRVAFNIFTQNVSAPGTAQLKLENGPSLKVHKVFWNARLSKLYCQGGVDGTIGKSTIHGDRLTADLVKKEITVTKVKGEIKLDDSAL